MHMEKTYLVGLIFQMFMEHVIHLGWLLYQYGHLAEKQYRQSRII